MEQRLSGAGGDVARPTAHSAVQRKWDGPVPSYTATQPQPQALAMSSCSLELSLLLRKEAVTLFLPVDESH